MYDQSIQGCAEPSPEPSWLHEGQIASQYMHAAHFRTVYRHAVESFQDA